MLLEGPNCPSSPTDASGPRACNLSTYTSPCLAACFSDSKISPSSHSSASPAQIPPCCLQHTDSSRHLYQLPTICCPPQFKHPGPTLNAKSCAGAPPSPTTSRQGQRPYTAFSGHLQICKQASYVVSLFADLQVSAQMIMQN